MEGFLSWMAGHSPAFQGLIGGLIITAFNTAGALLILIWRRPSERFLNTSLGFAAGAMLYRTRSSPRPTARGTNGRPPWV